MIANDAMGPLAVSGLQDLTAAQRALAAFLAVDPDLLAGAGLDNPAAMNEDISEQEMDQ